MRNLSRLGVKRIIACDSDPDRLAPMIDELGVQPYSDFEEALVATNPDLVFICTPPIFHIPKALHSIRAGAHVFVEKPLSNSFDGVENLIAQAKEHNSIVQVGYNLHFHEGLKRIRQLIEQDTIGAILWAQAEFGQYLPDWRPWQDYRQSYTARKGLGGGIILDASHELDYITSLLGKPIELICMAGKVSKLDVDVEDCATLLLRFPGGVQANIHVDFVQRGYTRSCKLVGTKGTILWSGHSDEIRLLSDGSNTWQTFPYSFDSNQMYIAEIIHFLNCVAADRQPSLDLIRGSVVLRLALAAQTSASERRWVHIDW
jgi:predicted dehydrogenase